MALILESFKTSLSALQTSPPRSQADAALRWSAAYALYAQPAQALDAFCVLLPTATVKLAGNFERSMGNGSFLADMVTNINAFWSAPVVTLTGLANSGVTVGVSPLALAAWSAGLSSYIASNSSNQSPNANPLPDLAALLHALTQGVSCTLTNLQSGVTTTAFLL